MDLVELLDKEVLKQDEWTLTKPVFGNNGQLEVVGCCRSRNKVSRNKAYILKCNVCSNDPELFGEGYFSSRKSHMFKGLMPCGCGRFPKWSKEQYRVICSRKAEELGHKFIDFIGEWKNKKTKIKMVCEKHGEWSSGSIGALVHGSRTCPYCKGDAISSAIKKPDHVMIASFLASGAFHPETKFWRSERKNRQGTKLYWFVQCEECGEVAEAAQSSLQRGHKSCTCGRFRQQQGYINLVLDGDFPVAVKFGVARDSNRRISQQQNYTHYTLKQHSVYRFLSVESCKRAERDCIQELDCGILLKRDMKDGWSETTYLYNLDKIIEIYERNGGTVLQ